MTFLSARGPALRLFLAAAAVCLLAGAPAQAAEQYPSGPNHRGIIHFDPYVVFPENRLGNGVYLDNTLIFSVLGEAIIDVLPLPVEGRFAFLVRDADGATSLGLRTTEQDGPVRTDRITPEVFHVVTVLNGVVYKKVFRLIDDKILDLLPNSRTADGVVAGPEGQVAFYHVATAEKEEVDGQERSVFGMRVHVSLGEDERLRTLGYVVRNTLPSLKLSWVDNDTISYTLADGTIGRLGLSEFQQP